MLVQKTTAMETPTYSTRIGFFSGSKNSCRLAARFGYAQRAAEAFAGYASHNQLSTQRLSLRLIAIQLEQPPKKPTL